MRTLEKAVDQRVASRRPAVTASFACAAMLVSYLPFSAVNGVLGAIGTTMAASTANLQWVASAFTVALVGVILSGGVLGDLYGRRRVTLIGLAFTVAGTAIGFLAGGLPRGSAISALVASQAITGVGAGLVMSSTLALIAATAPDARSRARAIAAWAAANVLGLGTGPFLSGIITEYASWRWLYPPIAVLTIAVMALGVLRALESSAPQGRSLDWPGQITGSAGVAALVYGVISGGSAGWTSPQALVGLVFGVGCLTAFAIVEHRSATPLLRPALFASRSFTIASLAAMVVLFTIVGIVFALSLFFAHQHVSSLGIAVRLGCLFGGNALASLTVARFQAVAGPRAVLTTGLLVAAAGVSSLLITTDSTGFGGFAAGLVITGAGCGLVIATSAVVAVQSAPQELAGMAGAANNAVRQLGGALGAAVIGVVVAARLHAGADFAQAVHTSAAVLVVQLLLAATATAFGLPARS
ncbi:MAG TPA: MFS transporter [Umezawaea sp.]|nr:MFS transporter [Umezawaea sp.]